MTKSSFIAGACKACRLGIILAFASMQPWQILLKNGALAQSRSFGTELQEKLNQYYATNIPLFLDIQFNQPSYVPGDTARFSLWLTTEREGLPVAGRQVIHVDLAARTGEILSRHHVLMNNGLANSQWVVPASLESGIYTIVAWTDWMNNGDRELFCYRELTVCGKRQISPGRMPLRVFSEGGALVRGIGNQIVLTGSPGTTLLLQANRNTIHSIKLDALGYGRLPITPMNDVYTVTDGNNSVEINTVGDGVAMSLDCSDSASALVFRLRSATHRSGCHLTMVSRGRVVYSAMIGFRNDTTVVNIPRKSLPEGLIVATVFDDRNEPLCQRILVAHLPDTGFSVSPEKSVVHPREKVLVSVATNGAGGMPLTVSVYADDLFSNAKNNRHAGLPSIRLPFGALNFKVDATWKLRDWNTFLVTQPWKRFQWSQVWKGSSDPKYLFAKYLNFAGKIELPGSGVTFDSVRITFFLRSEARVYEQFVDSHGQFNVDLFFDFNDEEEVIYTIDRRGEIINDATIVLTTAEDPVFNLTAPVEHASEDKYAAFAQLRESTNGAYQDYAWTREIQYNDANDRVEDELFEADVTVRLSDYVVFPTMEETLREIVPRLQHRWRSKRHTVTVGLSDPDMLAKSDPLYFIDGVLTDDTDYFMGLNPRNVATIKVISSQVKLRAMGILGRNGIVLVTTTIPDNHLHVPRTRKHFPAIGFTQALTFNNTPVIANRIPLLKSTIYLNPALQIDKDGRATFEVLMPDNTGTFRVEVTGMSATGTLRHAFTLLHSLPPTSIH